MKKRLWASLLAVGMLLSVSVGALAQTESFSGKVQAQGETAVFAPIGGTVESVLVTQGQRVSAGDLIATLRTTKVYADQPGTVTGVFGVEGDSISSLDSLYGGVLYMEPQTAYTLSASTSRAYDSDANKTIHVGETVYLSCYSDGSHTGLGIVTAVSGASYTVEVTSGTFELGESVVIYRDPAYTAVSRLGRGTVSRTAPFAVTGGGSIVKMHVQPGDVVKKGALLFETLDDAFDGAASTGNEIRSTASGILSAVNLSAGGTVMKNAAAASVYQDGALWIAADIPEADLGSIKAGDAVEIEFNWNDQVKVPGTVLWISGIGTTDASTDVTSYPAYIAFTPDENTRIGLSVTVSTVEASPAAEN